MEDVTCKICEADFRVGATVESPAGVPKCRPCAAKWPHARTKKEVQIVNPDKVKEFNEVKAREIVYEILEEANIRRHKCESCSAMFFRSKPMQVKCPACLKNEEAAKKETN